MMRDLDPAIGLHKQTHPVTLKTEHVREQASAARHMRLHHRLHVRLEEHALSFKHSAGEHHPGVARHLIDR